MEPVDYTALKKCALREVLQRERVYRRLVDEGRMSPQKADSELAMMKQIAEIMTALERGHSAPPMKRAEPDPQGTFL